MQHVVTTDTAGKLATAVRAAVDKVTRRQTLDIAAAVFLQLQACCC
jgi:hypothetical protein